MGGLIRNFPRRDNGERIGMKKGRKPNEKSNYRGEYNLRRSRRGVMEGIGIIVDSRG